jgi:hypothetical protein
MTQEDLIALEHRLNRDESMTENERLLWLNWHSALTRSLRNVPLLAPEFVAMLGRSVRFVDVRRARDLIGALGYIPGVDWIPLERASTLAARLHPDDFVVLISHGDEQAREVALDLEARGMRHVAAMQGGMIAWKKLGFSTSRALDIIEREDELRHIPPRPQRPTESLTIQHIKAHIGAVGSVRWMKMAALMMFGCQSCVDGRDETGVIGTPGGDAGEFLLALSVLETLTQRELDEAQLTELLVRRVDTFGRFYMHTDSIAAARLNDALRADEQFAELVASFQDERAWLKFYSHPPRHLRDALLEHLICPDHIGCGHLRLMMLHGQDYGIRRSLIELFLRKFMELRWSGMIDLEIVPLPGKHEEAAVINVLLEAGVQPFGSIPLISPSCQGAQMFIHHPQVSDLLRGQLCQFLCMQDDIVTPPPEGHESFSQRLDERARKQLNMTLGHLASGLPIYHVTFLRRGGFHVELVGSV